MAIVLVNREPKPPLCSRKRSNQVSDRSAKNKRDVLFNHTAVKQYKNIFSKRDGGGRQPDSGVLCPSKAGAHWRDAAAATQLQ